MSFLKGIASKRPVGVLDFGADTVSVVIAHKADPSGFQVLGAGSSVSSGFAKGDIVNLGDAVESVVDAVRKAEESSGVKLEHYYYNFDDAGCVSVRAQGTKTLKGEGEIRPSDVADACRSAERFVGHFERKIVYARDVRCVIDDRDWVDNPVGVFGRKLDVEMHIIQARSAHCEAWRRLLDRAQLGRTTPVLSALSSVYGVVPKEDRARRVIVADAGEDYLNLTAFGNHRIIDHRIFLSEEIHLKQWAERALAPIRDFVEKNSDTEVFVWTGDLAREDKGLETLKSWISVPVRVGLPLGVQKLESPRYAAVAGLLAVADEMEKKASILQNHQGFFENAKEKAEAFINEYF